jgi:hypothetical protein
MPNWLLVAATVRCTVSRLGPHSSYEPRSPRVQPLPSGAFFARWSTAVEMPPGQILREHRLVAQKKTAHGAPWTKEDVRELRAHSKARTPLPEIAKKMKRTERALRRKAGILGIGLGHRR